MKAIIPILSIILMSSNMAPTLTAYALNPGQSTTVSPSDCFAPLTTLLSPTYQGPVVLDAYWVDQGTSSSSTTDNNPVKKEIGPGEGPSVLAVVFNNRGTIAIQSFTGFLNLPSGFQATGASDNPQLLQQYNQASRVVANPAVGSFYGTVEPGDSFTVFFNIDVLPTAKVGNYPTTVVGNYYQEGIIGQMCTSALLNVPLVLPGKVVLDASSDKSVIEPQQQSPITITIKNKGSAPATGVVVTITNLGNSKGGGSSSSGGVLTLQSSTTQIVNLGANTFNLGTIPAGGETHISTTVYPSPAASGTTQEVDLSVTYQNAWGKLTNIGLLSGIVISPNPPQSLNLSYLGNTTSPLITAGKLDDLDFAVANNSTNEMSNIVVSLVPQSTSVSIVGTSTWTIAQMYPGDRQVLATKVFAANSLINTPTAFTLTANYVSKGQTQTNSLTLGTFVVGDIKLQLYSITVNSAGGSSSLSGNLLNQGSTTGLFTTIDLAPSPLLTAMREARIANMTNNQNGSQSYQFAQAQEGGSQGGQGFGGQGGQGFRQGGQRGNFQTQQFIGDLTPDSPIPFSIPIRGLDLLKPGMYPVSFKVVYADDLKNFHTVILNGTVDVVRSSPTELRQNQSIFDQIPLPVVFGTGVAIAAGIAILIKKRRAKKKLKMLTQNNTDIVSIFDDVNKKEHES